MTHYLIKAKIDTPKKILYRKTLVFKNGVKLNLIGETEKFNRAEINFLKKYFPAINPYNL